MLRPVALHLPDPGERVASRPSSSSSSSSFIFFFFTFPTFYAPAGGRAPPVCAFTAGPMRDPPATFAARQDQISVLYFDDPMIKDIQNKTRTCNDLRTWCCGGIGEVRPAHVQPPARVQPQSGAPEAATARRE